MSYAPEVSSFSRVVFGSGTFLNSKTSGSSVDPVQQVWEGLHFQLSDAASFPIAYPRPSLDISNRVLALAPTSRIVPRLAGILAGKTDFEDSEDT